MTEELCSWSHFPPPLFCSNYLQENKSLKALHLVLFKEVEVSFLVANRDYLGKAVDSALLIKCPGCIFPLGTSQAKVWYRVS